MKKLDSKMAARVIAKVEAFAETGAGDVAKIKGETGRFRLRVGDWRVVFGLTDEEEKKAIIVRRVQKRGEVYAPRRQR